jgi:hypothetical protein
MYLHVLTSAVIGNIFQFMASKANKASGPAQSAYFVAVFVHLELVAVERSLIYAFEISFYFKMHVIKVHVYDYGVRNPVLCCRD